MAIIITPCASCNPTLSQCRSRMPFALVCRWEDLHSASCLNGWGFGNLGISAVAAADFIFDLVGRNPRVVDGLTALQMQQWGPVLAWHHAERYGLGLMCVSPACSLR